MSIELKIKGLTLAQEARIIRRYEQRLKRMKNGWRHAGTGDASEAGDRPYRRTTIKLAIPGTNPEGYAIWGNAQVLSLQNHRRGVVRPEARRTHLARMFLKGTPYKRAEAKVHDNNRLTDGDWSAILRMAEKYYGSAAYLIRHRDPDGVLEKVGLARFLAQRFEEWKTAE